MTRTNSIKVWLTDDEHQRLKKLAPARGIGFLLRSRALDSDRRQEQTDRVSIVAELARIRNLLNQIARNSERRTPPDQIQIVAQLITVERRLSNFKTR